MYEGNKLFKSVLGKMPNKLNFYSRKNPLLFSLTGGFNGEQEGMAWVLYFWWLEGTPHLKKVKRNRKEDFFILSRRKKQEGKESTRLN